MSLAEEMLNTLNEGVSEHSHSVSDTDSYFTINPDTREIESTSRYRNVLMQYDHNSERYTFSLPRHIDGHDMSLCNSVVVSYDNIEDQTETTNSSFYDVDDLRVDPANSEMVIASWLVSRAATQLAGKLSFSIEFKCIDDDGNVTYEWATNTFNDITIHPRKKNTDAEVTEHVDLLEQWRTKIFGAGDSVMANIATEGETQVAAVKMESQTQQEAVELKGANTLATIPEDYTEINNKADEAVRTKSDAIVCEDEGEVISLTDSSDDHVRGMKLFGKSSQASTTGKNLLPTKNAAYGLRNGLTFTDLGDGRVNITGTATHNTTYVYVPFDVNMREPIPAGTYTLSGSPGSTVFLSFYLYESQETTETFLYKSSLCKGETWTFTLDKDAYYGAYLYIGADKTANETVAAQLELGSIATAYEPYTGGKPAPNPDYPRSIENIEKPVVNVHGKNLWNPEDNTVNISVEEGVWGWGTTLMKNPKVISILKPKTTYTMSVKATCISLPEYETIFSDNCGFVLYSGVPGGQYMNMAMSTGEGALKVGETRIISGTFTTPDDVSDSDMNYEILRYTQRYIDSQGTATYAIVRFEDLQIELGDIATDYEPYKPAKSIALDYSLPGIPVTSGGNYTDKNGQRWICNEVDLERGVYVQRVGNAIRDASSDEYWYKVDATGGPIFAHVLNDALANGSSKVLKCSHFVPSVNGAYNRTDNACYFYDKTLRISHLDITDLDLFKQWLTDNPIAVMYPLETPIETPLTAEEITAFKLLKTNYPNTTILNDAGAWMSVKYNADTKSYVENPKTLKLVDSSTGVVYELKIVDGNITVVPV